MSRGSTPRRPETWVPVCMQEKGVVLSLRHPLRTGMLYKVVIDQVAGVMETVHWYIWFN